MGEHVLPLPEYNVQARVRPGPGAGAGGAAGSGRAQQSWSCCAGWHRQEHSNTGCNSLSHRLELDIIVVLVPEQWLWHWYHPPRSGSRNLLGSRAQNEAPVHALTAIPAREQEPGEADLPGSL